MRFRWGAALGSQPGAIADAGHRVFDEVFDLLGRAGLALCRRAHFGGDHRNATALFTGMCGLHRGVQGQDSGLEGEAVDGRR